MELIALMPLRTLLTYLMTSSLKKHTVRFFKACPHLSIVANSKDRMMAGI